MSDEQFWTDGFEHLDTYVRTNHETRTVQAVGAV